MTSSKGWLKAMKLYNPPLPVDIEEYNRAIDSYLARAGKLSGVRSIYTMGSIKAPGLSDIDIIVVVENEFDPHLSVNLSTSGIDKNLYIHGPVVVPESLTQDLQYLIYATGLTRLSGSDKLQEISDLDTDKLNTLSLAYLVDFTESRLVQLSDVMYQQSVDQRGWMARLWSLTHSVNMMTQVGLIMSDKSQKVIAAIRDMRTAWLEDGEFDPAKFNELLVDSVAVNKEIMRLALRKLYEKGVEDSQARFIVVGNKMICFQKDQEECIYKKREISFLGHTQSVRFARHNFIYAEHLARYGYRHNGEYKNRSLGIDQCLNKRAKIVKTHWEWLSRHCPNAGSMKGYLGVSPYMQKGLTRSIVKLVDSYLIRSFSCE